MTEVTHGTRDASNLARRCVATTKRGPCKRWAILGGTVCPTHGGSVGRVRAKAAERLADLIDPNRALREAATLAYSDITELLDEQGRILPVKDWPKHMRGAVSGYETETVRGNLDKGDGEYDPIVKTKLKLWDKPKNLEMLFKHLGLLIERLEHGGKIEIGWKGE